MMIARTLPLALALWLGSASAGCVAVAEPPDDGDESEPAVPGDEPAAGSEAPPAAAIGSDVGLRPRGLVRFGTGG
jgi:hypothetical protein